jgi:aryl-alcohol dehydrogenase-like predicted oxidoreductase
MALTSGCNLIDTSTNYTDGASERCVGQVLAKLVKEGRVRREDVVVISKIGYVQGQNLRLAETRERDGRPFPEMVKYMDECWHCIHPQFLADQLERSLERLASPYLDVCLLHNPEYFFSDALHRGAAGATGAARTAAVAQLRGEFYRRLEVAFAYFESEVARGRIGSYGVSSNTCTAPVEDAEMTSLERMLGAAEAAGGARHHFAVLQLPMNLLESGAMLEANNGDKTVLEVAASAGIGVLVNRPLNAIVDGRLMRLAGDRMMEVTSWIDGELPVERKGAPLSQKALHVLLSTPGVSCVLLGMRHPAYVGDALPVMSWPSLPARSVRRIYEAFRS